MKPIKLKRKLLALSTAAALITAAIGPLPAMAGIDEVLSDGAYKAPLAQEIQIEKPTEQPAKQETKTQAKVDMSYQVRPGDTLWRIAAGSGLSVTQLAEANNLSANDVIVVGQTLTIPGSKTTYHRVASGEILSHIAGQYGLSTQELMEANNLTNPDKINVDQRLIVPGKASQEAATTATAKPNQVQIGGWEWPVAGRITSNFGIRVDQPHEGIDIGAWTGNTIKAPEQGRVVWAAPRGTYGLAVIIDHGNGLRSLYAHCSEILVHEGQQVKRGDPIAKVGNTGRSEGPHLHMEILRQGIPLDPLMFLQEKIYG